MKQITVVGAGFSGLTVTRALQKQGFQVTIFESSQRTGGLIETIQTPHGLVEKAAPSITRTDRFEALLKELSLSALVPAAESRRRLFYIGRLTQWPLTFFESLHLGVRFLISKYFDRLSPKARETVKQWGERTLTKPSTERLLSTALQGIYAGDASRMSATLILGPVFSKKKRDRFRGVLGFKNGMQELIDALEADIRARGGQIHFGEKIEALPEGPVVLAISASAAAKLLNSDLLSRVEEAPILTVTAFFKEPTGTKAFGCLIPRSENLRTLGVLLNHAIFPDREQGVSETWILGGATDPGILEMTDSQIENVICQERQKIFSHSERPLALYITRWPRALPHYDLILEEILEKIQNPPGVWLHGNWTGSIGLSRILERSDQLAAQIAGELK